MQNFIKADYQPTAKITHHAGKRGQQRGIQRDHRDAVFLYGDREQAVGAGCYKLSISYRHLKFLVQQGLIPPQSADRCRRLTIITDGVSIVTNYQQSL